MEREYAFIDEYGNFGWDLENPSVATHYIITAIIVKEKDLEQYTAMSEAIRKRHFQTGEMKSKNIAGRHARRQRILADVLQLPMSIFAVCIDKKKCLENMNSKGLQYKKSFYKFMNNIVHRELRRAFRYLTIVADEIGDNDYMQSFCRYVSSKQDIPSLLGEADFSFSPSHKDVRVQVADIISGTLAYVYDIHRKGADVPNYYNLLLEKINRIELYPKTYSEYTIDSCATENDYDKDIAELCFRQAVRFIENNAGSDDPDVKAQVIVLQYLLFRFMNNSTRGYIYTHELKDRLVNSETANLSDQAFRNRIIGKLRDKGVILASSKKGYKIPSKKAELFDFINHDAKIVIPMLERLKKCRDLVKLATNNELDLLAEPEYQALKDFFDAQPDL